MTEIQKMFLDLSSTLVYMCIYILNSKVIFGFHEFFFEHFSNSVPNAICMNIKRNLYFREVKSYCFLWLTISGVRKTVFFE
jgi:hypothetical protein